MKEENKAGRIKKTGERKQEKESRMEPIRKKYEKSRMEPIRKKYEPDETRPEKYGKAKVILEYIREKE